MVSATKVFVTGASRFPQEHAGFARELGHRLMKETNFVLITGGLASTRDSDAPALDQVVAQAAFDALDRSVEASQSRIITMLPESDPQDLPRFEIGSVVRVDYAGRRTRRYSMVLTSDAVVAVNGATATSEVIDLAYASGTPLIPVPATGGAALEAWRRYRGELVRRLRLDDDEVKALTDPPYFSYAVTTCLSILSRILRPRCFVAMPFAKHPLAGAFETIRSVGEEQGFQVIRIDQESFLGNIVEAIWDSIRNSDVVVADLTDHRPNVYYEMGISHALGKPTLLTVYSEDGRLPADIPFDVRVQRIVPYGTLDTLEAQLRSLLPVANTSTRGREVS